MSAPTITGPRYAPYYSIVTDHGTAPGPHEQVTLYTRWASSSRYLNEPAGESDGAGRFTAQLHVTGTIYYYVVAGGRRSVTHVIGLPPTTCRASGAAFTNRTISTRPGSQHFTQLTATRNGLWAGTEVDLIARRWSVVSWRYGHGAVKLGEYDYGRHTDRAEGVPSVEVVGVTPAGQVLAAVQHTDTDNSADRVSGYLLSPGRTVHLVELSGWQSARPTGVASDGSIAGVVRTGTVGRPTYRVVRWSADGRRVTTIALNAYDGVIDGAGDIAWHGSHGGGYVRRASGGVIALPGIRPVNVDPVRGAAGHFVYQYDTAGYAREYIGAHGVSLYRTATLSAEMVGASIRGDLLFDYPAGQTSSYLVTARGGFVRIPPQLYLPDDKQPGTALSESGTVAYTATDRRVHLFVCVTSQY